MNKKRILIFAMTYFPKPVGGAEFAIKEITDRLGTEQYEWHLISLRFDSAVPKEELVGNVHVHRIGYTRHGISSEATFSKFFYPVKILYVPLATLKAIRLNKKHKFEAIWCMMLYMTYPVSLLRLLGIRIPYAVTIQEGDTAGHVFNRWYIRPFKSLLAYGVRRASVVQSISTFLAGWAKRMGFSGTSVVIPNAVDTAHFMQTYTEEECAAVRSELGLTKDDTVLVTTSRLVAKNGIDIVIKALPRLPEAVKFVVFGTGPEEGALRKLAEECAVSNRVQFRGQIEHAVMPKYLKACDIFIRASRSEGMGNSFIEAMAAELPVVATQVGGIADFLFDAKRNPEKETTGWAVESDSPESIVDAISDIMQHPETVSAVTAYAKQMVLEQYDWNLIAARMETEVFLPILETHGT